jgi:RNA polymerase sigma factor (sigma-70 family)
MQDADRQDLRQEVCLGLLRAAATFDDTRGVKFVTHGYWHLRKAASRWREHMGHKYRVGHDNRRSNDVVLFGEVIAHGEADYDAAVPGREPPPEDVAYERELLERFRGALSGRQYLVLRRRLEGWTCQELGDAMGYTKRDMTRLVARLRETLRALLEGAC